MRVAYLVSSYHPQVGGVEMHVKSIADACAARGDEVTVLTHRAANQAAEEVVDGVRVLRFPLVVKSPNYALSPELFKFARAHASDFDLVHSHSYHTLVGQAAVRTGLPFIFTPHYHGTGHTQFRKFLHEIYRPVGARQFAAADAVICVSAAERALVIRDFPATAPKITVIPNGTVRRDRGPSGPDSAQGERVVLTIGRLERYKNLDLVIRAVRAMNTDADLIIVGAGPDRTRLEEAVRAVGSPRSIRLAGRLPDDELEQLLRQASVVTSASSNEAFGLTLADGLMAGTRVVASDIPAHRELGQLAGPGAPVSFVNPHDLEQYASALEEALAKGRVAPGSVQFPSWADVTDETRKLYAGVVHSGSAEARPLREEHV